MRRRGGRAAVGVLVAVLGGVGGAASLAPLAGPAAADTPEEIRDRLIDQLDGYVLQPEGDYLAGDSGPVDITEAAPVAGGGVDPLVDAAGYARVFTSDDRYGTTVVVTGIDITGYDGSDLLEGLAILGDLGDGPEELWVDFEPPLISYSVRMPTEDGRAVNAELSAFVADDLLVTVEARGIVAGIHTMRDVMRGQIELTPPTLTPDLPGASPEDEDQASPTRADDIVVPSADDDDGTPVVPLAVIAMLAAAIVVVAIYWFTRRPQRVAGHVDPP